MTQSLWDEAANRFRATATKVVTTGLGDRKSTTAPSKTPPPPPPVRGPTSAGDRVLMAEAGGPMVAQNAFLRDAVSRLGGDPSAVRAFAIAVGTVATNKYNPADMRASFQRDKDPALAASLRGFDAGISAATALKAGTTQSTNLPNPAATAPASTIFGMPKLPVLAVGAVGIVGIATYLLYPAKVKGLLGMAGDRSRGRRGHRRYGRRW